MKKATLIALIGTVIALLARLYGFVTNFTQQSDNYGAVDYTWVFVSLAAIIGMGMIGYFFLMLYKKQG